MTSPSWNPQQYLKFEAERARPFSDLIVRVPTSLPRDIVDLGCGPGNTTRTLLDHWPQARVRGIDSSTDMIAAARARAVPGLEFELADVARWEPATPVDLIVSNATLHWVPEHVDLLPKWLGYLRPGGSLAFQVPLTASERAADALDAVISSPRWAAAFAGVPRVGGSSKNTSSVRTPQEYADILGNLGCTVDAWETTYVHVLPGPDPVLEWYSGSGLRPFFDVLDSQELIEFRADVAAVFRDIYPRRSYGTLFPFRRVFVVAQA